MTLNNGDNGKTMKHPLLALIIAAGLSSGLTWAIMKTRLPVQYNTSITNIVVGECQGMLSGSDIVEIVRSHR